MPEKGHSEPPTLRGVAADLRLLSAAARRHHDLDLGRLAAQLEHDADSLDQTAGEIDTALDFLRDAEQAPQVRPTLDQVLTGRSATAHDGADRNEVENEPATVVDHQWGTCPECGAPVVTLPMRSGHDVVLDRDVVPSEQVDPHRWWRIDPRGAAYPVTSGRVTPAVHTRHLDTCPARDPSP